MPSGRADIKGDGKQFSKDYQPKKKRGVSLVSKLKKMLKENPERVTKILESVIKKAEEGDLKAVEMVLDRVDGKAVQHTIVEEKNTVTELIITTAEEGTITT